MHISSHSHLAHVRALSALHSRASSWPSMWLLSLRLDFLLFISSPSSCLSSSSPSSTSATSSSRSSTRRSWKTCATPLPTGVRAPTTSSTSPQFQTAAQTAFVRADARKTLRMAQYSRSRVLRNPTVGQLVRYFRRSKGGVGGGRDRVLVKWFSLVLQE